MFACLLAGLTYLDRAAFGAAGITIVHALGLSSEADLKSAHLAFALAYGLFEIPTGWLGDRFGPRRILIRIVLWWSFFTTLTGLVGWKIAGITLGELTALTVVRFWFAAGEAGAFPNIARALQDWFPPHGRARAQGVVWMSARITGGLTPLIWTFLVAGTAYTPPLLNWRLAFVLFGLLGVAWCIAFASIFRNRPDQHPKVNAAERELIAAGRDLHREHPTRVPWGAVLFNRNLVCLYLMYFGITYGWYFNMTYLPACLETRYGVASTSVVGSLMKGGPLWLGAVGCLLGGYWTDRLYRRGMRLRWARRLPGLVGLVLCAGCYLAAAEMPAAWSFALAISLAAFFNDLVIGGAWATTQDVGGRHTGVVAACLNVAASAGAAIAGWASGQVLQHYLDTHDPAEHKAALVSGYQTNLILFAIITALSAVAWLGADAERPVPQN
jgi:MFS transporter, ACS family, glucarate transporter